MSWAVDYSEQAKADLWGIHDYIAYVLREPAIVQQLIGRIMDEIDGLGHAPYGRCIELEPWFRLGMRRINVGNYAVFLSQMKQPV